MQNHNSRRKRELAAYHMTLERADETNAGMHQEGKEREGMEDTVSFMPGDTGVVQSNNSLIHGIARSRASAEGSWACSLLPCYCTVRSNTRNGFCGCLFSSLRTRPSKKGSQSTVSILLPSAVSYVSSSTLVIIFHVRENAQCSGEMTTRYCIPVDNGGPWRHGGWGSVWSAG